MNSAAKYLQSQDGKVVSVAILIILFSAVWGYIKGKEAALKKCVDPYDFGELPQKGEDLKEKKDATGKVIKPEFTIEKARALARRGYDSWESSNPFKKNDGEVLARELLDLNDDELVLVCRVYVDAYSDSMYNCITNDYWGLAAWASEILNDDEYKLTQRLKRLNQD